MPTTCYTDRVRRPGLVLIVTLTLLGPIGCVSSQDAGATEGRERWIYEHTRVSARRLNPFGRNVTVRQTPYEQLVLTFQNGVLSECTYLAETYRTEDGVIVPTERSEERCGE